MHDREAGYLAAVVAVEVSTVRLTMIVRGGAGCDACDESVSGVVRRCGSFTGRRLSVWELVDRR